MTTWCVACIYPRGLGAERRTHKVPPPPTLVSTRTCQRLSGLWAPGHAGMRCPPRDRHGPFGCQMRNHTVALRHYDITTHYDTLRHITTHYDTLRHVTTLRHYDISPHYNITTLTTHYDITTLHYDINDTLRHHDTVLRHITTLTTHYDINDITTLRHTPVAVNRIAPWAPLAPFWDNIKTFCTKSAKSDF